MKKARHHAGPFLLIKKFHISRRTDTSNILTSHADSRCPSGGQTLFHSAEAGNQIVPLFFRHPVPVRFPDVPDSDAGLLTFGKAALNNGVDDFFCLCLVAFTTPFRNGKQHEGTYQKNGSQNLRVLLKE